MKYLALIFIIFIHCSQKKENGLPISIEGEWIPVFEDIGFIYDWSGLKFENDSAYKIDDRWGLLMGPYSISEDKLLIKELKGKSEYTILNLTEDSLIIKKNGDVNHYYSRKLEFDKDLNFNTISISAHRCFDLCWEFDYVLDSDGLEVFNGKYNTQTLGIKKGKLNDKLVKEIDSLFKRSNINQLDPDWVAIPDVDGWLINFDINYNENESINFSTTDFNIPYRIKPIFQRIKVYLNEEGLM
ncbi:hypothetical protein EL17_18785 [Anditalea andensis]|uniref:DUF6438 domain-containing protein n=2 Tax=Anditalea andensis TaxID=1048983 RepID=A0A074KXA2_9BACT|nr:hypothetical protein EL17_18785 [Anditalea andensis]